jgi:hypothetical protein
MVTETQAKQQIIKLFSRNGFARKVTPDRNVGTLASLDAPRVNGCGQVGQEDCPSGSQEGNDLEPEEDTGEVSYRSYGFQEGVAQQSPPSWQDIPLGRLVARGIIPEDGNESG